ncbi:hypothetical protein DB346_16185 [Verrucomicrobia bacterium LW23]|nr:hypothetical protein DB346_16185 [Verrucomicrobia bacterium LW23]
MIHRWNRRSLGIPPAIEVSVIDTISSTSSAARPDCAVVPAVSRSPRTAARKAAAAKASGDRRKAAKASAGVESHRSPGLPACGSTPATSTAPAAKVIGSALIGADTGSDADATVNPTPSPLPTSMKSTAVPFVARDMRRFTATAPVLEVSGEDESMTLAGLDDEAELDFDIDADADGDSDDSDAEASFDDESEIEREAADIPAPARSCWKNAAEREAAIISMMPLIKTIAARLPAYWYPGVAQEDLQGAGMVGLVEAVDNFSPDKGCSLRTYCSLRIRGAMFDELRRQDWMPRSARRASRKLTQMRDAMTQELGREPQDSEVCERMGLSQQEYAELTERLRPANVFSLQESVSVSSEDDLLTHEEVLADPRSRTASQEMLRHEDIAIIRSELKNLPARHLEVMTLFYIEGLRTNEIAERFSVSESRISQIHSLALSRMRAAFLKRREA